MAFSVTLLCSWLAAVVTAGEVTPAPTPVFVSSPSTGQGHKMNIELEEAFYLLVGLVITTIIIGIVGVISCYCEEEQEEEKEDLERGRDELEEGECKEGVEMENVAEDESTTNVHQESVEEAKEKIKRAMAEQVEGMKDQLQS